MDLNETTSIINQASKATQVLQSKFNTLVNEVSTPKKEETLNIITPDLNTTKESNLQETNASILTVKTDIEPQGTSIRGLIIFKTRVRPYCEINGKEFAKKYMQEDWDDIYHEKELKMEVLKACPKIEKKYKDKWTPHLYQFVLEYASDSDTIPEC